MSRLKVYWPDEAGLDEAAVAVGEEPRIVRFPVEVRLPPRRTSVPVVDLVRRAQALYENRACPHCRYPIVEPIELHDGLTNRNNLPIPGTATLVGFRCGCCGAEWPVD